MDRWFWLRRWNTRVTISLCAVGLWGLLTAPCGATQRAYVISAITGTGSGDDPQRPMIADLRDPGAADRVLNDDVDPPVMGKPPYRWVSLMPVNPADGKMLHTWTLCVVSGEDLSALQSAQGVWILATSQANEDLPNFRQRLQMTTLADLPAARRNRIKQECQDRVGLTPANDVTLLQIVRLLGRKLHLDFEPERLSAQ